MKVNVKKQLPIIIGIGLPLFLVLWILVFVYIVPSMFVKPKYDFIYITGFNLSYVRVVNGAIKVDDCTLKNCDNEVRNAEFYFYDVSEKETIPLTMEQALEYRLDSSEKSPDGYAVRSGRESSRGTYFFPFFWDYYSDRGYYISKEPGLSEQIYVKGNLYSFKFLGWILQ
jgi:hypothetical protein